VCLPVAVNHSITYDRPMTRVRIRLARSGDSRALAELRYGFRTETEPATETKSRFARRCASWMRKRFWSGSSPWRCWVLDDGKRLLGHVCVQLFEKIPNPVRDEPELHAYVTNFYVVPEMRSRGFGKKLLNEALSWCRAQGSDANYSLGDSRKQIALSAMRVGSADGYLRTARWCCSNALTSMLIRFWNRLPAIVRGIVVAELVVTIGTVPPSVAVILNIRTSPSIPWMLVVTAAWLSIFWWYVTGHGWPRSTQEARRRDVRARSLSKSAWIWALIAGSLGITGTIAIAFVTARVSHLPREAFAAPVDFAKYGTLMIGCAIACISATAGVVEEAGFRGYLISPIQRQHGWPIAILISGIMFFLDHHLSHAYATFAFLPFFLAISAVHGLLVKYSGSIRPSVLLHSIADFIVIPVSYGLVGTFSVESVSVTAIDRQFLAWVAVIVICFALFVIALRVLGARSERTP